MIIALHPRKFALILLQAVTANGDANRSQIKGARWMQLVHMRRYTFSAKLEQEKRNQNLALYLYIQIALESPIAKQN